MKRTENKGEVTSENLLLAGFFCNIKWKAKLRKGDMDMSNEKVYVFGHKSPDTDTITSAIVYASLKRALGVDAEAVRLGEINKETEYVLDFVGVEVPAKVDAIPADASGVILVDHNEFQQSADNIKDVRILEVVDHHRVANFETADPLYFRVEPVGCTATILLKLFKENKVDVSKENATLMLSAIISDTLLLKSPTCTDEDVAAAKELAEIAGVDAETYGLDMLKAGTDLSDKTAAELITLDAKQFTMGDAKVMIGQVNAIDVEDILSKQAQLETAIETLIAEHQLDLFVLAVTDIIESNSAAVALGTQTAIFEKAFDVTLTGNRAFLPGVVSRKKQIVPVLEGAF